MCKFTKIIIIYNSHIVIMTNCQKKGMKWQISTMN